MSEQIALYCVRCGEVVSHTKIEKLCICSVCGTERSACGRRKKNDPAVRKVPGKRGRKPALSDGDKQEAYRLHTAGLTNKAIAIRLGGVSMSTVRKAWKEMEARHAN